MSRAYLGAYLVQRGQYDEAAAQLDVALEAEPASPRAAVAMAQLDMGRSQYGSAEKRLIALGKSDDWLVAYSAAMAMADLAGVGVAGSANVSLIQAARRQLDTVGGDRAEMPNVLAHRAALDLPGPDDPTAEAAAAIARARALAPGRYDYAFIQAQILSRRGEFAAARTAIGPLMSGLYPPGVRDSARSLMSYIVNAENRQRTGAKDDVATFLAASGSKSIPVPGYRSAAPAGRRPAAIRPRLPRGPGGRGSRRRDARSHRLPGGREGDISSGGSRRPRSPGRAAGRSGFHRVPERPRRRRQVRRPPAADAGLRHVAGRRRTVRREARRGRRIPPQQMTGQRGSS